MLLATLVIVSSLLLHLGYAQVRTPVPEICGDGLDNDYNGTVDNGCPQATAFTASGPDYVTEAEDCLLLSPASNIVDTEASGGAAVTQAPGTRFGAGYLKCTFNVANATYYVRLHAKTDNPGSTIFVDTAPFPYTPTQAKASLLFGGQLQLAYAWIFANWLGSGTAYRTATPSIDPVPLALNGAGALYIALSPGVTLDTLCLSTTLVAACDTATPIPNPQYTVFKLGAQTVTLDGVLENVWDHAAQVPLTGYNSGSDNGCCCRLLWDNTTTDRLYLGCTITDTRLESLTTANDSAAIFTDDGVELTWKEGIDTDRDATTFKVVLNTSATQAHLDRNYPSGSANNAYTANVTKARTIIGTRNTTGDLDGAWTIEAAMDLGWNATPGDLIRLELRINDRDGGSVAYRDAFGLVANGIDNVANWGYVVLSDTEVPGTPDTTAPTVTSTAETNLGQTTATLTAATNEAGGCVAEYDTNTGTPYSFRAPATGTIPSTAGVCTISVTGLTASTGYFWRMCVTDGASNTGCSTPEDTFTTAAPSVACDHWASHPGSGTGCTEGTPCSLGTALAAGSVLDAGETLCLNNGTYTGSASMIDPPDNRSGTAAAPITIKALNDGQVLIDGQDARRPISLVNNNDWWIIEGVNVTRGNDHNVRIGCNSDNNIVRRVVGWDVSDAAGGVMFLVAATTSCRSVGNLLEDVAGFGRARKIFSTAQNVASGQYGSATIRRAWGIWQRKTSVTSNPKLTFEISYDSGNTLCENCLGTWNADSGQGTISEPDGTMWGVRRLDSSMPKNVNARILGSIFYAPAGYSFTPPRLLGIVNSGIGSFEGVTISDSAFVVDPSHTGKHAARLENSTEASTALVLQNALIVGPSSSLIQSQWAQSNVGNSTTLSGALGQMSGSGSLWERIPGLCTRFQNGVLTSTKLWPWPMNSRIIAAMTAAGRTPIDVTAQMESLFGTIPAACKN